MTVPAKPNLLWLYDPNEESGKLQTFQELATTEVLCTSEILELEEPIYPYDGWYVACIEYGSDGSLEALKRDVIDDLLIVTIRSGLDVDARSTDRWYAKIYELCRENGWLCVEHTRDNICKALARLRIVSALDELREAARLLMGSGTIAGPASMKLERAANNSIDTLSSAIGVPRV